MNDYKLFYCLLGCNPDGRHTEQHDVFFGIAKSLWEIVPDIKKFWPEAGKIHIDSWREVTTVGHYAISIVDRQHATDHERSLFFINLGGYLPASFEEHHYKLLAVASDISEAVQAAKQSDFYKQYNSETGVSHVDNKYGVDVDEVLQVADILPAYQKEKFAIQLTKQENPPEDVLHIGYLTLQKIMQS